MVCDTIQDKTGILRKQPERYIILNSTSYEDYTLYIGNAA